MQEHRRATHIQPLRSNVVLHVLYVESAFADDLTEPEQVAVRVCYEELSLAEHYVSCLVVGIVELAKNCNSGCVDSLPNLSHVRTFDLQVHPTPKRMCQLTD